MIIKGAVFGIDGVISTAGIEIFKSSIGLIKKLKRKGIKIGLATSSKNCSIILKKAGLTDMFETIVDGVASQRLGLKGKPQPDIFVKVASNMGLHPSECMMVENAISGIRAGQNGNFALVVGVSKEVAPEVLRANGADIAVKDLGELNLNDIDYWFKKGIEKDSWRLNYYEFIPAEEKLRETLTVVGNGYFAIRGCLESEKSSGVHYPATYIAGVYNRLSTTIAGKKISNNDLVNCGNWFCIEIKIGKGEYIHPLDEDVIQYEHNLNMRDAVMERKIRFRDSKGRITTIHSRRFVSMDNQHLCAIQFNITPENYSEKIEVRSSLDGSIKNEGVARYGNLNSKHLIALKKEKEKHAVFLNLVTNNSNVSIFIRAKTDAHRNGKLLRAKRAFHKTKEKAIETINFQIKKNVTYTIEKIASVYTSIDKDVAYPWKSSAEFFDDIENFDVLLKKHKKAWHSLWKIMDIKISGDRFVQKVIRLHMYHLLTTASVHNRKKDIGLPARGLHGEAYRGHMFWDTLFTFPFYCLHLPEVALSFLMYRYRRLDEAREYAKENGFEGALYPWQTADTGTEETQIIHYNPVSGKWDLDLSRHQRHCSFAIYRNIWDYYLCTEDEQFMQEYGIEMMLEIARCWASMAKYDKIDGKYHIEGVMGPDEFHEKLPDAKKGGLKDNAYTNILTSWTLTNTYKYVRKLPENIRELVFGKINFSMSEMSKWKNIAKNLHININNDGVMEQFEGYFSLKELDWEHYRKKYRDIGRMDRILRAENDSSNRYKVAKQPDVLMLFYMLSPKEVCGILKKMGYKVPVPGEFFKRNYAYCIKRTSHGSTLSSVVYAVINKYVKGKKSELWKYFINAMRSDIYDTQGGTTPEGIHCGVMAGTLDTIVNVFAGVRLRKKTMIINPDLPKHWDRLTFGIIWRNSWYDLDITKKQVSVSAKDSDRKDDCIIIDGKKQYLKDGFIKVRY
ncbi:HAD hydrolase-like protein [bacterium]|nr:HAD hydrolase-like protein [bacterium]